MLERFDLFRVCLVVEHPNSTATGLSQFYLQSIRINFVHFKTKPLRFQTNPCIKRKLSNTIPLISKSQLPARTTISDFASDTLRCDTIPLAWLAMQSNIFWIEIYSKIADCLPKPAEIKRVYLHPCCVSRGHTTHFYLGKNDLPGGNSPEIARGKFI